MNHAITTSQLRYIYDNNVGIHGLDLKVPRHEVYGFLGRNGAGKTTTLNILAGVFKPQSGNITFADENKRKVPPAWKAKIGYVPQEPHFFPASTPIGHQRFLRSLYPDWNDDVCLWLFDVFEIPGNRKVHKFSTGMKSKLAVALAMAHQPELLILDEPTAGLDPLARRRVLDLICESVAKKATVILSTHIVDDLEGICTHLGVIEEGLLRYQGPIKEFQGDSKSLEDAYLAVLSSKMATGGLSNEVLS